MESRPISKKLRKSSSEVECDKKYEMEFYQHLPDIVWCKIFSFLENESKFGMALTGNRMNDLIKSYPSIYKTFKLTVKGSAVNIPPLTRPISTVIFCRFDLSTASDFSNSVFEFFKTNGKFIRKFFCESIVVTQEGFCKILNELPNLEHFSFHAGITNDENNPLFDLMNFQFKYKFSKLKSLYLNLINLGANLPVQFLEVLFGNSKKITTLGVNSYLSKLIYNKPNLERLLIKIYGDFSMDTPAEDYEISTKLKELIVSYGARQDAEFPLNQYIENLETFIKCQYKIEKFSFKTFRYDRNDILFDNIVKHVIGLKTLKKYANCNIIPNMNFFKANSSVEELEIHCSNSNIILPFYPNLKKVLFLSAFDHNILNNLKNLEELRIGIEIIPDEPDLTEYEKIDLKKLSKLEIYGCDDLLHDDSQDYSYFYEIAIKILQNHENIIDFLWGFPLVVTEFTIEQQKNLLSYTKKLKRYSCHPVFPQINTEEISKYLDIFVDGLKELETLFFYLGESSSDDRKKVIKIAHEYFNARKTSIKFEYSMEGYIVNETDPDCTKIADFDIEESS